MGVHLTHRRASHVWAYNVLATRSGHPKTHQKVASLNLGISEVKDNKGYTSGVEEFGGKQEAGERIMAGRIFKSRFTVSKVFNF